MKNTQKIIFATILLVLLPMVLSLQKTFEAQETDLVNFKPSAIDPDNEEIYYDFGKPLNQSGQWQTNYDDSGEYGIDITASDGETYTSERIILTVRNKNRPPMVNPISLSISEGETISLHLPKEDLDGDKLTYSFEAPFNKKGEWITTHNDEGSYSFKIPVNDGELESLIEVIININNVDRAVFLNLPPEIVVNEGDELIWEVDSFDPDGDNVDLEFTGLPEGSMIENEKIIWKVSYKEISRRSNFLNNLLNILRIENKILKTKTIPITVKACSNSVCETAETKLIVNNVNQKPLLESMEKITIRATETLRLNITAQDPDGDILRYYFSQPLGKRNGVWKTHRGDEGEYTIYVTASDGTDQTTIPLVVNVLKDNQAPRLTSKIKNVIVNEGEPVEINFKTKDPDNDSVTISIEEFPEGSSLEELKFSWVPSFDTIKEKNERFEDNLISKIATINKALSSESFVKELKFIASDGEFEDTQIVKVTVKNVNRAPELLDFLPEKTITTSVGEPVIFNIAVKDLDNDKLKYEWSFSLHEPRVKGTNTIERIFVTPGSKKVKVHVTDGRENLELVWKVNVLPLEEVHLKPVKTEYKFNTYVIEG